MDAVTNVFVRILTPVLRPVSRWLLSEKRTRPTWYFETAVVALLLFGTALWTSPDIRVVLAGEEVRQFFIVWLSAFAVLGTFLHAKVGYRMAEALAAQEAPQDSCYEWSGRYWLWKEILWLVVFLLSGAYPAITGVVIFILYPAWRKIHVEERRYVRCK